MNLADLDPDPHAQFDRWFAEAVEAGVEAPERMALASATRAGVPSVRFVLLKGHDPRGFVFYTNYTSRKALELAANPVAAGALHWEAQARQVRVEGAVERLTEGESAAYFATRARESQVGAWASPQSRRMASRAELDRHVVEVEQRFAGKDRLPLPPFWGGYRILATVIEFWQGRPGRLHDRVRYVSTGEEWQRERLAP